MTTQAFLYPTVDSGTDYHTGDVIDVVISNTTGIDSFNYLCALTSNSTEGSVNLSCAGEATQTFSDIRCGYWGSDEGCGVSMTVPPCTGSGYPWYCYYSAHMSDGSELDTRKYYITNTTRAAASTFGFLPTGTLPVTSATASSSSSGSSSLSTSSTGSATSSGASASSTLIPAQVAANAAAAASRRRVAIGAGVGGGVGGLLLIIIAGLLLCWCVRKRKQQGHAMIKNDSSQNMTPNPEMNEKRSFNVVRPGGGAGAAGAAGAGIGAGTGAGAGAALPVGLHYDNQNGAGAGTGAQNYTRGAGQAGYTGQAGEAGDSSNIPFAGLGHQASGNAARIGSDPQNGAQGGSQWQDPLLGAAAGAAAGGAAGTAAGRKSYDPASDELATGSYARRQPTVSGGGQDYGGAVGAGSINHRRASASNSNPRRSRTSLDHGSIPPKPAPTYQKGISRFAPGSGSMSGGATPLLGSSRVSTEYPRGSNWDPASASYGADMLGNDPSAFSSGRASLDNLYQATMGAIAGGAATGAAIGRSGSSRARSGYARHAHGQSYAPRTSYSQDGNGNGIAPLPSERHYSSNGEPFRTRTSIDGGYANTRSSTDYNRPTANANFDPNIGGSNEGSSTGVGTPALAGVALFHRASQKGRQISTGSRQQTSEAGSLIYRNHRGSTSFEDPRRESAYLTEGDGQKNNYVLQNLPSSATNESSTNGVSTPMGLSLGHDNVQDGGNVFQSPQFQQAYPTHQAATSRRTQFQDNEPDTGTRIGHGTYPQFSSNQSFQPYPTQVNSRAVDDESQHMTSPNQLIIGSMGTNAGIDSLSADPSTSRNSMADVKLGPGPAPMTSVPTTIENSSVNILQTNTSGFDETENTASMNDMSMVGSLRNNTSFTDNTRYLSSSGHQSSTNTAGFGTTQFNTSSTNHTTNNVTSSGNYASNTTTTGRSTGTVQGNESGATGTMSIASNPNEPVILPSLAYTRLGDVAIANASFMLFRNRDWSQCLKFDRDQICQFVLGFCSLPEFENFSLPGVMMRFKTELVPMMKGEMPSIMMHPDRESSSVCADCEIAFEDLSPLNLNLPGTRPLPHYTVFDLLGWCMARSAGPLPSDANDETYFLPLLSVFAKWCSVIVTSRTTPSMVSITTFNDSFILGASLPESPAKRAVQEARRVHLEQLHIAGFPINEPFLNLSKICLGQEAGPILAEYGHCAESHAFMALCTYDERVRISMHVLTMRVTPASTPQKPRSKEVAYYDPKKASQHLEPACENCTKLFSQVFGSFGFIASRFAVGALRGDGALATTRTTTTTMTSAATELGRLVSDSSTVVTYHSPESHRSSPSTQSRATDAETSSRSSSRQQARSSGIQSRTDADRAFESFMRNRNGNANTQDLALAGTTGVESDYGQDGYVARQADEWLSSGVRASADWGFGISDDVGVYRVYDRRFAQGAQRESFSVFGAGSGEEVSLGEQETRKSSVPSAGEQSRTLFMSSTHHGKAAGTSSEEQVMRQFTVPPSSSSHEQQITTLSSSTHHDGDLEAMMRELQQSAAATQTSTTQTSAPQQLVSTTYTTSSGPQQVVTTTTTYTTSSSTAAVQGSGAGAVERVVEGSMESERFPWSSGGRQVVSISSEAEAEGGGLQGGTTVVDMEDFVRRVREGA